MKEKILTEMFFYLILAPHLLLIRSGTAFDVSLDPINSPNITYPGSVCVERVFYGFLSEDYRLIFYGADYNEFYRPTYLLFNNTFGTPICSTTRLNIHKSSDRNGMVAGFGWVGKKFWIVGGDTNAGKYVFCIKIFNYNCIWNT
jgi:hypothetical protein